MKPITFSLIVLTALAILVTGASASVLSIGNGEVTAIGSTATVNIVLDEAPAGLSGYSINVSVENPVIATVSAVSYPAWASLIDTSTLPSADCRVKASDMSNVVQSGAMNTTLATITLQGLAGGATTVNLTVNLMSGDEDEIINPTISAGTFTVNVPVVTPEAAFTSDVQTGTVPLTVAFTDQSENAPTSWAWDFGDTGTSTAQSPSHQYTAAGNYTVTLTATNTAGSDTEVKTDYITVLPPAPVANFNKNISGGQAPLSVQFTDQSTNSPTAWAWDFQNDGTIDSTEQNPVFVYTAAGSYSINLTASNAGGSNSRLKENNIIVTAPAAPVAAFTSDVQSGMIPLTIQFTDQSTNVPTSWLWDFGDGGTSTDQNATHTYTTAGTYTVNLTATNAAGSGTETKTNYITAIPGTVFKEWTFESGTVEGFTPVTTYSGTGSPVTLSVSTSAYSGSYALQCYATNAQGYGKTIVLDPSNATNYKLEYWVWSENTGYGYTSVGISIVDSAGNMIAGMNGGDNTIQDTDGTTICSRPAAVWVRHLVEWNKATGVINHAAYDTNGTLLGSRQITRAATVGKVPAGIWCNVRGYPYDHTIRYDDIRLSSDSTGTVPPVAAFTAAPLSGSAPLTVTFTNQTVTAAPTALFWDFGDGSNSTDQNPLHTYTTGGTFTVNLTATNAGGQDSEEKTGYITVTAPAAEPVTDFTATPTTGDIPLPVQFTDTSTNTPTWWSWNFGDNPRNVYVTTSSTASIFVIYPNGTVGTLALGSPITGPYGIAFDGQGNLYAVSSLKLIYKILPDGTVTTLASGFSGASRTIAVDHNGYVYYADVTAKAIIKVSPDGTKTTISSGYNKPYSVAVDYAGNLYVGDNGNKAVYKVAPDGTKETIYTGALASLSPYSIAVDYDGNLYIGVGTQLFKIYPNGTQVTLATGLNQPYNIAVDDFTGNIYEANYGSHSANLIHPDGTISTLAIFDKSTVGIAIKPDSYAQSPSHTYSVPGTYNVSLIAANSAGSNLQTKTDYITVNAVAPVAAFTSDVQSGTAPLTVNFTDQSTNTPTAWAWVFGDGATSTEQNPSHQYAAAGIYNVSMTATNTAGSDPETKAGYIVVTRALVPPVAAFTANATSGIAPLSVKFSDLSTNLPTSWSWSFGDGGSSADQDPVHIFASPGTYTVSLTATNADGSDSEEKTNFIQVLDPSQPTVLVVPQTMEVAPGATNVYAISINTLPSGLAGYNLSVSLADANIGEITALTLPSWASLNSSSATPADSVWFSGLDLYRNVEAGATNVPLGTVMVRGDTLGSTAVVVVVHEMDADGGSAITPAVVPAVLNVYQPVPVVADFTADNTSGYFPLTVKFTDLSTGVPVPSSWSWNFGDGATSTERNPTHTYSQPGLYNVSLTVANVNGQDSITKAGYITVMRHVVQFPGCVNEPLDPDHDGRYEDINGNGRLDFHDVVTLYQNMQWVRDNTEVGTDPFDFNGNGRLDYDDVVLLYYEVLAD
jgi:PKD repeat protein